MSDTTLDPTHQLVIIARLSEFCQFKGHILYHEKDPWLYMHEKLNQIQEPLLALKTQLLAATKRQLVAEIKTGGMTEERYSDYKALLERLVSRGEFVDIAIHLSTQAGPAAAQWVADLIKSMKPVDIFVEERLTPEQRNPSWDKLVKELSARLNHDVLGKILTRKPRTAKRRAIVLRKLRGIVAEYCTVMHIPITANDTFTPFMLPRVEALIAANLRFLRKYR
ncbi:MAG: hypothetical protein HY077_02360 [Elusimicrobia bacterium]|nr:hypothetical protein [Elusimicrobiota bacterium]